MIKVYFLKQAARRAGMSKLDMVEQIKLARENLKAGNYMKVAHVATNDRLKAWNLMRGGLKP